MEESIKTNTSAAHAPKKVVNFANNMAKIHGCQVLLTMEKSGYHFYIPCPDCLETHGERELNDPKYSINVSMYMGMTESTRTSGRFLPNERDRVESKKDQGASVCMRTRSSAKPHKYNISDLLRYDTVTTRHPDILTRAAVVDGAGSADREQHWEKDPESGQMCPPPPGETMKLSELPPGHPALAYLTNRGYNIKDLEDQFNCKFCYEEYPEGQNGIYYRKMPGGWKDTPRNRIIFYSMIDGVPLTWQARVLERISDCGMFKYMMHPYAGGKYEGADLDKIRRSLNAELTTDGEISIHGYPGNYWGYVWNKTHVRVNAGTDDEKWMLVSPFDELRNGSPRFVPSKYRTAKYSSRQMMGWDAAVERAATEDEAMRWVVLCEGPLDAARVGPGGVALIGSSINPDNARKVVKQFSLSIIGMDNDRPGREAAEKINTVLEVASEKINNYLGNTNLKLPVGRDLGDLTPHEFDGVFAKVIKAIKQNT